MAKVKSRKPFKNEHGSPHKLTEKQRVFIAEYLAGDGTAKGNATESARRAGYAHPEVMGARLRSDEFPLVKEAIDKALAKIETTALISAQDLLRRIHELLLFNPAKWFRPSDNPKMPGFMLSAEEFSNLPDHIGQLIKGTVVSRREIELPTGAKQTKTVVYIELMSKDKAAEIAAKYQLGQKVLLAPAQQMPADYWEGMHGKYALPAHGDGDEDDPVEARLREAERVKVTKITTNGEHKGAGK
jgi:hypothetical protein